MIFGISFFGLMAKVNLDEGYLISILIEINAVFLSEDSIMLENELSKHLQP